MATVVTTNMDVGCIAFGECEFDDEILTVGGAVTVLAGTILARDTSTLKLVPFVIGGSTNGNGVPGKVLTYDVTSTGAGDVPIRALSAGKVKKERLIEDGDGDGDNLTALHFDALRSVSIVPVSVEQLGVYAAGGA